MAGGRWAAPGGDSAGLRSAGASEFPLLPYARQSIDDDDVAAVVRVLRSDWLTQGPAAERFEANLARRVSARHAVVVSSATAGLHLAALALGLKAGAPGITSPITFAASANCILYAGGRAGFADVDPVSGLMTPASLARTLAELAAKGAAPGIVVAVSYGGQVADLPAMQAICREHGWRLIEDAAHSLGATYRHLGGMFASGGCHHSDAAVFSFHPVKHICAGEGGAVLTNDDLVAARVRQLRSHGIIRRGSEAAGELLDEWHYEQVELGYNYRMTEMQAALGDSQLSKLDTFLDRRRSLAQRYIEALGRPEFESLLGVSSFAPQSAYHLFVVHFRNAELRRRAYGWLRARGIMTQVHYIPVYRHPYHRQHAMGGTLPGAEQFYQGCLSLPLFPRMLDSDQQRVLDAISAFSREVKR